MGAPSGVTSIAVADVREWARIIGGRLWFGGLLALGVLSLGIVVGSTQISMGRLLAALTGAIAGHLEGQTALDWYILSAVRAPRVLVAALVGGGLAMGGAALQALFRNPLADPGVLGVSSGAALSAVVAINFGWAAVSSLALPVAAFVGAGAASLLVMRMAAREGRLSLATILLAGIAVNALCGAGVSAVITFARRYEALRDIVFWMMGGLDARSWQHVAMVLPAAAVGTAGLMALARDLNVLSLGTHEAQGLGVDVGRTRWAVLALVALLAGAAVSVAGVIGFVGLVVPHILRLLLGPDNRRLLPASLLGGATFLVLADLVARTMARPVELRVGLVTSLVGGPFFLFLLHRHRARIEAS